MGSSGADIQSGVTSVSAADTTITVSGGATTPAIKANLGTTAGTVAAGNDTRFTEINGVTISGAPATGNVPIADSATTAHWGNIAGAGGGTGDVVGPAGAVSGHLALFDTNTGKLLKDGGPVAVTPAQITGAGAPGQALIVAADAATARAAIGAGTSNLALGTAAGTALAGNTPLLALGTTAGTALAGNTTAAQIGGTDNTGPVAILHLWSGTNAQYTALATKDPNTLYIVNG